MKKPCFIENSSKEDFHKACVLFNINIKKDLFFATMCVIVLRFKYESTKVNQAFQAHLHQGGEPQEKP